MPVSHGHQERALKRDLFLSRALGTINRLAKLISIVSRQTKDLHAFLRDLSIFIQMAQKYLLIRKKVIMVKHAFYRSNRRLYCKKSWQ